MIKAILFDMDDTLLDINLEAFMVMYQARKTKLLTDISNCSKFDILFATAQAYFAIDNQDRTDSYTNEELFNAVFESRTNIPLGEPALADLFTYFDAEVLPHLNNSLIHACPKPGAHEAVETASDLGLKVALATNPSFSKECIYSRMRWGQLHELPFDYISHMSNSCRLKPSAQYYKAVAQQLGCEPHECLMVGNDRVRDIVCPTNGMKTLYVGKGQPAGAFWTGSINEIASLLPYLVENLNGLHDTRLYT